MNNTIPKSLNLEPWPSTGRWGDFAAQRTDAQLIDARSGWLIPGFILIIALYFTSTNQYFEMNIAWSAFLASVSCMAAIAAVHHRIISFVTLVCIWHMMTYPVAAVINLLLDVPNVRHDLWVSTDLAMWGCTVGCASLAAGAFLWEVGSARPKIVGTRRMVFLTKVSANIFLFSFLVPAVLLRFTTGLYDERFSDDFFTLIAEKSRYQNILSYIQRLSQIGIYLQLYRYVQTKSTRDLVIFGVMCLSSVLAFLPTGNRMMAYGFVLWLFIFYLSFETKKVRAVGILFFLAAVSGVLSATVQLYRETEVAGKSAAERFETMASIASGGRSVGDEEFSPMKIVAGRIADYVSTGRIIDYSPDPVPFRGTQGLEDLWMMFVPKLVFSDRLALGEAEISAVEREYQVHAASMGGGSSPTMIIGDLYSRWGWSGIMIGMGFLGVVLTWASRRLLYDWNIQTVCFFVLYAQTVPPGLTGAGLFNVIVMLTRDLLICWLLSRALASILNKYGSTFYGSGRLGAT